MCDIDIGNPASILRAVQCIACAWKVVKSTTIVYCVYKSKDVLDCVFCKEAISSYEALDEELKIWDPKEPKNKKSLIPFSSEEAKFKDASPRVNSIGVEDDDEEMVGSVDKNTQSVVKFIEMSSALVEDLFDLQDLYDKKKIQ